METAVWLLIEQQVESKVWQLSKGYRPQVLPSVLFFSLSVQLISKPKGKVLKQTHRKHVF